MDKRFWAILGVIVVIFGGIIWVNGKKAGAPENGSNSGKPTSHIEGNASASIKLVEYGDYQCPVCGLYFSTVKQVVDKYKDDISFQFSNFPLTQMHPNAFAAARAAESADKQGKFWQMHDLLYVNQNTWSQAGDPSKLFQQYAQQLGLNADQFKKDFASDAVNKAINADLAAGNKLGIDGTPTFYLNGKVVELKDLIDSKTNEPSIDQFSKVIDAAIANNKKQ